MEAYGEETLLMWSVKKVMIYFKLFYLKIPFSMNMKIAAEEKNLVKVEEQLDIFCVKNKWPYIRVKC